MVKGLSKRYSNKGPWIISGIDIEIKPGTIYAIVGPNGSGKTTLIKSILNLTPPQKGSVFFNTAPIIDAMRNHQVAFLPDGLAPYAFETLSAFADKFVSLYKSGPLMVEGIRETARYFQVDCLWDRPFGTYSLGQKQRALLAVILGAGLPLVILDEPTRSLDPIGRRMALQRIRYLATRHGTTVLVSSHLLNDIETIADKVGLLYKGSIIDEVCIQNFSQGLAIELLIHDVDGRTISLRLGQGDVLDPRDMPSGTIARIIVRANTLEDWYVDTLSSLGDIRRPTA